MKATAAVLGIVLGVAAPILTQAEVQDTVRKASSEKQQKQQARFKACAQQAKGRKGDERKQFMSSCLSR